MDMFFRSIRGFGFFILFTIFISFYLATTLFAEAAIPIGDDPERLVLTDLNRDGNLDIAVVENEDDFLVVILGNGDGTFQTPINYAIGEDPVDVVAGDLNGDTYIDLVTANHTGGADSLYVSLGNGNGTFQNAVPLNFISIFLPVSVCLGDLNGDTHLDLVVAENTDVVVLLGNGNGAFQSPIKYAKGASPDFVTLTDLNEDSHLDMIIAVGNLDSIGVLLGNGDGTFQNVVAYGTAGEWPTYIAAGYLNGDTHVDLAVSNYNSGDISVLLGNGNGTLQSAISYNDEFSNPEAVAIGDLNGDGYVDLATPNYGEDNVSILLGAGDGTFDNGILLEKADGDPVCAAIGDMNKDGDLDIVVSNHNFNFQGMGTISINFLRQLSPYYNEVITDPPTLQWTASNCDLYRLEANFYIWGEPLGYPSLVRPIQLPTQLSTNSFTIPDTLWSWIYGGGVTTLGFEWRVWGRNTDTQEVYTTGWSTFHRAAPL